MMRVRFASTRSMPLLAAAVALLGGGCYEVAFFYPAAGLGGSLDGSLPGSLPASPVIAGNRLGLATRLTGKDSPGEEGQAFLVLSVHEAYTARSEEGGLGTIIRIGASVVNQTERAARFEAKEARLEVAGRVFKPKWTYRDPAVEEESDFARVDGGGIARYDIYFELGSYAVPSRRYPVSADPSSGIPLGTVRDMKLSWKGGWGGEERSGEARFVRDYPGSYPAAGAYLGGGWHVWADPWPLGFAGPGMYLLPGRLGTYGTKLLK